MRFCGKCGASLAPKCPSCSFESPPGFRFCGKCGASLDAPPATPKPSAPAPEPIAIRESQPSIEGPTSVAERRQVTVLFCDLVGSTQMSEQLDPEELREVVQAYQAVAGEVIERYEGHIAQYLGDGILAYFGYPRAQEDAARRAVLSALAIVEGIIKLNVDLLRDRKLTIAVRIGIHTGSGVVGDVGGKTKREQLVIGNTPNVAARLQGLAEPNTVVISAVTRLLTGEYFVCESLGAQMLKGVSAPLEALRVTGERRSEDPFSRSSQTRTPFVGRSGDLSVLRERFARAAEGHGQAALICGDPGIGKSRLLAAFRAEIGPGTPWITCRCSPYATNTALFPLVETFESLLGVDPEATPAERLSQLDAWTASAKGLGDEAPALLAEFLSIPWPEDRSRPALTPQQEREATLKLLTRVLIDRTAAGPIVVVVEDLHWIDPSTLAFVQGLLTTITTERVLLLLATRPSFTAPWPSAPHVARVDLGKLADHDAEQIVLRLSGGKPIPRVVQEQILEKCDGVPLFIEELTKSVLESGLLNDAGDHLEFAQPFASPVIPVTLQDSLTARLDRMGPAKELLQLASAVGRRFVYELLAAVAAVDEATLRDRLQKLVTGELIYREASPRHEAFKFKHALIQDTAYASMLKTTRRGIHERIARVIEERFAETADVQPELLARHYEEAQLLDRAVDYLTIAGQRAMQRSALVEGLRHYTRAIELLEGLPASPERDRRELAARLGMGGAIIATRGYAALDVEKNYARARVICRSLGDPPETFPVLYGLWVFNLARSHRAPTLDHAEQLLSFVSRTRIPAQELSAYFAHGCTLLYVGQFDKALAAFDEALARYKPSEHWSLVRFYGDDHGLFSQVYVNWILVLSGKIDLARRKAEEVLALAEELHDPLALAMVTVLSMLIYRDMRDGQRALDLAERAIRIAEENSFPFWASNAHIGRGWFRVWARGESEGIAEIQGGLAFFDLIEQKLPLTYWSGYLIDALLLTGQHDEGLALADRCIGWAEVNVDAFYLPDLYRQKAELLLGKDAASTEAEACYQRGLSYAAASGADFLGLRCAASYARWLQKNGRVAEARAKLAEARAKLTEGSSMKDVVEADALLSQLQEA